MLEVRAAAAGEAARPAAPSAGPAAGTARARRVPRRQRRARKAIGADKKVAAPTTFGTGDTIYASVVSEGAAPQVALKARWTYEDGQLVNESAQAIAPTGPAATEFQIAKASGWPTGKYKVEISANGAVVSTKDFVVN